MKLLDKRTVQTQVASQKKQQIDEGIKLASKVDTVRETLGKEEKALAEFRVHSITTVQKEIDDLITIKNALKTELESLEEQKRIAQLPLEREWHQLTEAKQAHEREKEAWGEKSDLLVQREEEIIRTEQQVAYEKERIAGLRERVTDTLSEATHTLEQAVAQSLTIRAEAQAIRMNIQSKEKDFAEKEAALVIRETRIRTEWNRIGEVDAALLVREKQLTDREATLERNINRLKK